jgi:hypothetical protein
MANSRLYKIAHPGHDGDYNGGLEVHSSLMDAGRVVKFAGIKAE